MFIIWKELSHVKDKVIQGFTTSVFIENDLISIFLLLLRSRVIFKMIIATNVSIDL